jgi:hypothetical protein
MRPILATPFTRFRALTVTLGLVFSVATAQALAATPTTTTLTASSNNMTAGAVVTLTATVTNPAPVTHGTVVFCNALASECTPGRGIYGSSQLTSGGSAVLRLRFGTGVVNVQARFLPANANAASTSLTNSISVGAGPSYTSSTSLAKSGATGNYTLSGTVTGFGSGSIQSSVSFIDTTNSNLQIGTAVLGTPFQSFAAPVSYGVGNSPNAAVVADLNGDGIQDIVEANYANNTISVLLGKAGGTFQPQVTYATGVGPYDVAVGDFNGDGIPDIVTPNGDGTISVLLGNGDGTFRAQAIYAVGGGPVAASVVDFNGDGIQDLAIACNASGTISVLLGNGDGTFQNPVTYVIGRNPSAIASGDFNGDGTPDLVATNASDGTISVLLGNGDGTFRPQSTYTAGSWPYAVATGDFDGNGTLDLAVTNYSSNSVSVFLGNGDGTFQPQAAYTTSGPLSVAIGDFNSDGTPDLAVGNYSTNSVTVLLGNGNGTFQAGVAHATGSGPGSVAIGDFNGDGLPDLVTANNMTTTIAILLGDESETYRVSGFSVLGSGTHNVEAVYLGDGSRTSSSSPTVALTASLGSQTISFATVLPTYYGVGYVTLSATGGASGNSVVFSVVSGPAYIANGNWLEITGVGTVVVAADQAGNSSYAAAPEVTQNIVVGKESQTITFYSLASVTYGVGPIILSATASSTLPVSYSVLSGPGTVSGNTLTVTGAGTIVIAADQAGNASVLAAPEATQNLVVLQANQTVTVGAYPTFVTYGVAPISLSGSSTSGLAVTFTLLSGPGTLAGNTLTVTGAGTIWLEATQAGNSNYRLGAANPFSISVLKATPMLSVASSGTPSAYGSSVTFTATTSNGPTGLVIFNDGGFGVAEGMVSGNTAVGSVSSLSVGSHTITASYHGDNNYNSATSSAIIQVVSPQPQSIIFAELHSTVTAGAWPVALSATATSYLPVTFRVLSGPGTVVGDTLTVTGLGTVVVAADQSGNAQYAAAAEVTQTITGVSGVTLAGMVGIVPGSINTIAGTVNWSDNDLTNGSYVVSSAYLNPIVGLAAASNRDYYLGTNDGEMFSVSASTGAMTNVAGCNGDSGPCNWLAPGESGPALQNGYSYAKGIVVDANQNVDFTDGGENVYQLNTHTGVLTNLGPNMDDPTGAIAVDSAGNIYAGDDVNIVWKWTAQTQTWSIFAGTEWTDGNSGDGGQATDAQLGLPASLAIDNAGNLYISDTEYNVIRKVDTATGIITTIAGTTVAGYSGDGGQATAAQIGQVWGLATDPAGILYLADSTYNVVRQIVPSTGVITTIAGNGAPAYSGDGGSAPSASLNSPTLLTVDTYGNLYVVDQTNSVIREIGPSGVLSFGSVSVASDSSPSPVTLENRGVSAVQFSANPSFSGDFSAAAGNTCGTANSTLAVGATCTIPVVFTPTAPGARTGILTLTDNGMSTSQEVSLSGMGVAVTPSISVSCSPNPITYGPQTTTCTTTVGGGATGSLVWTINGGAWTTTTLSGGSSSAGLGAGTVAGSQTIGVTYSGDSSHNPATASTTLTINKATPSLTVTCSLSTITYSNVATSACTASISGGATGTLTWTINGGAWTSTALNGTAWFGAGNAPGTYTLAAAYSGDANYNATSASTSVTVQKATPTLTWANPSPITYGTALSAAQLNASSGGVAGSFVYAPALGTVLGAGSQTLAVTFSPTDLTDYSTNTATVTLVVSKDAPTITLTTTTNPATYGTPVTFTAQMPSSATGSMTFLDGATVLGTGNIAGGVATYTINTLSAGSHSITVSYAGDSNYSSAVSPVVTQVIMRTAATISLTSSLNPSTYGDAVTFTVTATGVAGLGTPTGTVAVSDGGALLAIVTLDASGAATKTIQTLIVGSHSLTAVYGGDTNYK